MRMPKSINTVKRQIAAKIRSLGEAGTFIQGSFIERRWKCARPDCICNRTGRKHTAYAVTGKVDGKTPHVLSLVGSTIGFHPFTGTEIPAGKAYYVTTP